MENLELFNTVFLSIFEHNEKISLTFTDNNFEDRSDWKWHGWFGYCKNA